MLIRCFANVIAATLVTAALSGQLTWTQTAEAPWPEHRHGVAMVDDTARQRVVLFGGASDLRPPLQLDDTWEWNGTAWQRMSPASSPPGRASHSMVFDAARGVVVMFGGFSGGAFLNDTWEYDGTTWTQRTPATSPPARLNHAMVYDVARQRTVLFGGAANGVKLADTWEYDGTTWTQRLVLSPPAVADHAMAYDEVRQTTVLFGGQIANGRSDETWEWDGSAWNERTPFGATPRQRFGHAMEYDPVRQVVLLSSGVDFQVVPDLWAWDGTTWTDLTPTIVFGQTMFPGGREQFGLAFDRARAELVVFGGYFSSAVGNRDTWTWNGTDWSYRNPGPMSRSRTALAYDEARQRVVMFGGHNFGNNLYLDDTWEWDGIAWTQIVPATRPTGRNGHAMAYDPVAQRVVLFGGYALLLGHVDDTWEWDGGEWVARNPAARPPARRDHVLVAHRSTGTLILNGGEDPFEFTDDTWAWDGNEWQELQSPSFPSEAQEAAAAYDEARRRTVISHYSSASAGTWEWNGSSWAKVANAAVAPQVNLASAAYDPQRGRTVLYGGSDLTIPSSTLWEWDGTLWSTRPLAAEPAARDQHVMAYDRARSETVMFGGMVNRKYQSNETWILTTDQPASYVAFGASCTGSSGAPSLVAPLPHLPWIDEALHIEVAGLPAGNATSLAFGVSNTQWSGLGLPFGLGVVGMTGCSLLTSIEILVPVANVAGSAVMTVPIPNDPGLLGAEFHNQAWVVDDVNPAGLITSHGATARVGMR